MSTAKEVDAMLQRHMDEDSYIEFVGGGSYDGFTQVETIPIDTGRWTTAVHVIIREDATDKLFRFSYAEALTEYQEDEYYGMVTEVEAYEETVVVTRYREADE